MLKPELLSPAGSMKAMQMAFTYGADAIYAGLPRYSLRVRNNEFDLDNLRSGIDYAHQHQKQFYVVTNLLPHNSKLKDLVTDLTPVINMNPDALIVSDPGIIYLLRDAFPNLSLHLSVQANTMNWASVKFWQNAGISRVILSRELGLNEIAEIKQRCPEIELEVFVHGALCIAYSGRCLISSYMNKRDANQGACTNACRWSYQPKNLIVSDNNNEEFELEEDEQGSYLFNSKDLCAVSLIEQLTNIGVNSLKIEGRTKSPYYVARTAQVYRKAIDDALAKKPFNPELLQDLQGLANRGYTQGFLQRHQLQSDSLQNYERGHSEGEQQLVGELVNNINGQYWEVNVKNHFEIGDQLLLMTPSGNHYFRLENMWQQDGQPTEIAPGSGHTVLIPIMDVAMKEEQLIFCMLIKIVGNLYTN